jgi:hypothetical protein
MADAMVLNLLDVESLLPWVDGCCLWLYGTGVKEKDVEKGRILTRKKTLRGRKDETTMDGKREEQVTWTGKE